MDPPPLITEETTMATKDGGEPSSGAEAVPPVVEDPSGATDTKERSVEQQQEEKIQTTSTATTIKRQEHVAPTAPSVYGSLVIDSGAIIRTSGTSSGFSNPLRTCAHTFYTIPEVLQEIKDSKSKQVLETLPFDLKIKEPCPSSVRVVSTFAKLTGDYPSLSSVDMKVLALQYELEKEGCHGSVEHLRKEPKRKIGLGKIEVLNKNSNNNNKEGGTTSQKAIPQANNNHHISNHTTVTTTTITCDDGAKNTKSMEAAVVTSSSFNMNQPFGRMNLHPALEGRPSRDSVTGGQFDDADDEEEEEHTKTTVSVQEEGLDQPKSSSSTSAWGGSSVATTGSNVAQSSPWGKISTATVQQEEPALPSSEFPSLADSMMMLGVEEDESKSDEDEDDESSRNHDDEEESEDDDDDDVEEDIIESNMVNIVHGNEDETKSDEEKNVEAVAIEPPSPSQQAHPSIKRVYNSFGKYKSLITAQGATNSLQQRRQNQQTNQEHDEEERTDDKIALESSNHLCDGGGDGHNSNNNNNKSRILGGTQMDEVSFFDGNEDDDNDGSWINVSNLSTLKANGNLDLKSSSTNKNHSAQSNNDKSTSITDAATNNDGSVVVPKKKKKKKKKKNQSSDIPPPPSNDHRCACATTDFAMQNVILQMGMTLVSVDGTTIRRIKHWVTRCSACFTIYSNDGGGNGSNNKLTTRLFCSKCGSGDSLERISASVDSKTGRYTLYLKNKGKGKPRNLRGTVYSLPKPGNKQNRFQGDLLLREDQLMMGAWNQKVRKGAIKQESMFGSDLTDMMGLGDLSKRSDIQVGFGRRNPNSTKFGRERRGKKKKNGGGNASNKVCGLRRY